MFSAAIIVSTLATTAMALPQGLDPIRENKIISENVAIDAANVEVETQTAGVCKRALGLLPTKPECCGGDLLDLIHHGCAAPYPAPGNVNDFVTGCLSTGKVAECCASALLGVGIFCHNPTVAGSADALDDTNAPASVVNVTESLNETEAASLASAIAEIEAAVGSATA